MGFVENLVDGMTDSIVNTVLAFIEIVILNPLETLVGGFMVFLQQIIVGTPYPRQEVGSPIPAVTSEPANAPWPTLYELHETIFQPYAYMLLFLTIITVVFVDILGSSLGLDEVKRDLAKSKSKMFNGFLLITFWWYIGTLILASSDALTSLLMAAVSDGGADDEVGLAAIWQAASDQLSSNDALSGASADEDPADSSGSGIGQIILIPMAIVWASEYLLLAGIAIIWIIRMLVLFVLMPIMPIFIALWVMHIPGFDRLQEIGGTALKWFASLAFVTLPAAIVVAVMGRLIEDLLDYGTTAVSNDMSDGSAQLRGYNTNELIAHPEVGSNVYGEGVSGLGATDPAQLDAIGGLGAILLAILMVIAAPIIAGLAPFLLFRSEIGGVVEGAVNPAAGIANSVASTYDSYGDVKESARTTAGRAKMAGKGDFGELADSFEVEGDSLEAQMKNSPGALFGVAGAKMASQTQDTASQIKSGAGKLPGRAASGVVRVDEAQQMIREHRGELSDIAYRNTRETVKKGVNPAKQKARMTALSNKPEDVQEAFADKVAEQRNHINNTVENRRERQQRIKDMSPAELRSRYETEAYTPDEEDLDVLLENDDSIMDAQRKDDMLNEFSQFRERGSQSKDMAIRSMTAMEETIRDGLYDTSLNPDPYLDEVSRYRQQVMNGEMTPDEAMDALGALEKRIQSDIQTDEDVKGKYKEMEEQYEKFGANMSQSEFSAQSHSLEELQEMDNLEEVIGGFAIRENRAKDALKEAGLDPKNHDMAELKENPDKLARLVGAETFNNMEVSEKFKATESLDSDEAKQFTEFTEDELERYDVSTLKQSIDNEVNSDLDADSASRFLTDEDMDRVQLSSWDSERFSESFVRDLNQIGEAVSDRDDVESLDDLETAVHSLDSLDGVQNNWDISELADELGLSDRQKDKILSEDSDLSEGNFADIVEQGVKANLTKQVGEAHNKAGQEIEAMKYAIAQQQVVAQEEYSAKLMREMVENAPSKEAAVTLLESQQGALMEEAGIDSEDFEAEIDESTRHEFVRDIVEQELTGEEIESAISERFHEEFEDTDEMLENLSEIQGARNIVEDVDEALGDTDISELTDDFVAGTSASELLNNPDRAAEDVLGNELEELQKLESGQVDSDTLDRFDVDIDSAESAISDDDKDLIREKAEDQAVQAIESKIERSFGVNVESLGFKEVNSDNVGEVLKEATIEKQAKELDEKMRSEQMAKAREESR